MIRVIQNEKFKSNIAGAGHNENYLAEIPVPKEDEVLIKVEYVGIVVQMYMVLNQARLFRLKTQSRNWPGS